MYKETVSIILANNGIAPSKEWYHEKLIRSKY